MYKYNTGDYKFVVKNNIKIVSASIKQILKNKQEFEKLIKKKFMYLLTHLAKIK